MVIPRSGSPAQPLRVARTPPSAIADSTASRRFAASIRPATPPGTRCRTRSVNPAPRSTMWFAPRSLTRSASSGDASAITRSPPRPRQLDCVAADRARGARDGDGLVGLEPERVEREVRGHGVQEQRRRLRRGGPVRAGHDRALIEHDELRVGSPARAERVDEADHGGADRESAIRALAQRVHHPGEVDPRDVGPRHVRERRRPTTGTERRVGRIDRDRGHAHAHLPRPRFGRGQLHGLQHLGATEFGQADRLHVSLPYGLRVEWSETSRA